MNQKKEILSLLYPLKQIDHDESKTASQEGPDQHIGRIMQSQIHAGESNDHGIWNQNHHHDGRMKGKRHGNGKSGCGMAGRKRIIRQRIWKCVQMR